ncbi:MAG: hypothetical protein LBE91_04430, partial [Tannerella sp.]|nr:hypothetical protein [Tannerella sp.]
MKKPLVTAILWAVSVLGINAQSLSNEKLAELNTYLTTFANREVRVGQVGVDSVDVQGKNIQLFAGENLSYIPFNQENVNEIYAKLKELLPEYRKITLISDTQPIENLALFTNRKKKDLFTNKVDKPLITNLSKPYKPEKGLLNRHLTMWQSHGWYYEQKLARWEWQRARIFQTVEDLYTQSYVLPYLVPMLENAGANVLLPRERDTQKTEIIVDEDVSSSASQYQEITGKEAWKTGVEKGFSYNKPYYLDGENPFKSGTYREIRTIAKGEESRCEWIPDIPEKGEYAVYVSYKTLPKSADDARYTVYHLGGQTDFSVNQKMGGGTWIFLGFFSFEKGKHADYKIVLTNKSRKAGQLLTADAVKIGGGMGNIARMPHPDGVVTENVKSSDTLNENSQRQLPNIAYQPETSGYPRYTEGSRYWLQWAGAPDSVYNRSESKNDYTDDYQSRAFWVNYLAGGSSVLPNNQGLNIPVDMALAFHTDAGTTFNDSIIGTLGIYMTHFNDEKFENGKTRWLSRDLTNSITNEIVRDIRREYEPQWSRRFLWNRSYAEARIPNVPTMLLELLSHQNLADMKYGLDPRFRFAVSRSVYKGILKFEAQQYGYQYVVQPLPIKSFGADFEGDTEVKLFWQAVEDVSEPTARPDAYILYTRIDDGDFDNGQIVNSLRFEVQGSKPPLTPPKEGDSLPFGEGWGGAQSSNFQMENPNFSTTVKIEKDRIYSFKIAAVNAGGESFPSEILSVCRKSNERGNILIINGFDRLSAPFSFATADSLGGFLDFMDHGAPDGKEYNYIGSQYEFRRVIPWMDDDAPGFGASNANYETTVIAGNTFDYPFLHGKSIVKAGYSFISTSRDAVTEGFTDMNNYRAVDLILGKQRQTKIGRGVQPAEFKTFPKALQEKITDFCQKGGNIFVSGAYVATDLWDTENPQDVDKEFAMKILKYKWRTGQAAVEGKVKSVASPFPLITGNYEFHTQLNPDFYAVESPDAIEPADNNSFTVFRYSENNLSAGVAYSGADYKTFILGFPCETIKDESERDKLMEMVISFLT